MGPKYVRATKILVVTDISSLKLLWTLVHRPNSLNSKTFIRLIRIETKLLKWVRFLNRFRLVFGMEKRYCPNRMKVTYGKISFIGKIPFTPCEGDFL